MTDLVTSLLDQLVSAYIRRRSYSGNEPHQTEHHIATGFVRAISVDEKDYIRLMLEIVYTDGYELSWSDKPETGDIITLSSNVDGYFRLSRTQHPYVATTAPGFPKPPPVPTVACDHEIVDQSLHVIPVRLHEQNGGRFMTVRWCERCGAIRQGNGDSSTEASLAGEWELPRYARTA